MAEAVAQRTGAGDAAEAPPTGTFASLRLRNYRLLLLGSTIDNLGMWIQQVTMSWLVYDITGSGAMLGLLNLSRSASTIGLAPVSGVIIDAVHRRTLMLATAAAFLVLNLALGGILLTGHDAIWYLFVFAFLSGVVQAIDLPLRQSAVFWFVPRAYAANAVALTQTGSTIAVLEIRDPQLKPETMATLLSSASQRLG